MKYTRQMNDKIMRQACVIILLFVTCFSGFALAPLSSSDEGDRPSRSWGSLIPPSSGLSFFEIVPRQELANSTSLLRPGQETTSLDDLYKSRVPPKPFQLPNLFQLTGNRELPRQYLSFFRGGNYPRISFLERYEIKRPGSRIMIPDYLKPYESMLKFAIENYLATSRNFSESSAFLTVRQGPANYHSETGNHWYVNGLRSSFNRHVKVLTSLPVVYMWTDFMPDQYVTSSVNITEEMDGDAFLHYLEAQTRSYKIEYTSMKENVLYKLPPGVILRTPKANLTPDRIKTTVMILFYQSPPKNMDNNPAFGAPRYTGPTNASGHYRLNLPASAA